MPPRLCAGPAGRAPAPGSVAAAGPALGAGAGYRCQAREQLLPGARDWVCRASRTCPQPIPSTPRSLLVRRLLAAVVEGLDSGRVLQLRSEPLPLLHLARRNRPMVFLVARLARRRRYGTPVSGLGLQSPSLTLLASQRRAQPLEPALGMPTLRTPFRQVGFVFVIDWLAHSCVPRLTPSAGILIPGFGAPASSFGATGASSTFGNGAYPPPPAPHPSRFNVGSLSLFV